MNYTDFRSDTSTMPSQEMYKKMNTAKLGNDGYGDDPTVNELENMTATLFNKEAALLFPTGTMANLTALMVHCKRGDEVIVEENSHIYKNELGGLSSVAQLVVRPIEGNKGIIQPDQIRKTIRLETDKYNGTGLICIENTHNHAGGTIYTLDTISKISEIGHSNNIPLHIDGARIFNASIELRVPIKDLVAPADSVMFCLSKGLGCPMGSMLVGTNEFIKEARKIRKMFGGTMRQSGIIAASGIVALSSMIDRLKEDHANAKKLAHGLSNNPFISINIEAVETNIIKFKLKSSEIDGALFKQTLEEEGILVDYRGLDYRGYENFRMVTHKDIDEKSIDKAIYCIEKSIDDIRYSKIKI